MASKFNLTKAEIVARDCRRACIHELAHAIVARRSVRPVLINITPVHPGGTRLPRQVDGRVQFDAIRDPLACAAVGWAGYLGEVFEADPHIDADRIMKSYPPNPADLSESVWRMVRAVDKRQRDRVINDAIAAIRSGWPEILQVAHALEEVYHAFGLAAAHWDGDWRLTDGREL